jgi:hypothetical protein
MNATFLLNDEMPQHLMQCGKPQEYLDYQVTVL